ncbi:hypothetical protein DL98DRAFT_615427, partial [Cadophora sp. DSE1049]
GPGAQYFEVQAEESSPAMPSGDVDLEAIKKRLNQEMQQADEEQRRRITEPEAAREPNPWLRRVGWVEHSEGFDRTELRVLVAPVKDDEPELDVVGLEALFEANRKEVDKEVQMPFDSWMDITSVTRYTERRILRLWIALLNQPLQDDEYKSVLISGLAILGMQEGEGWLDAEDYTPKYSAVIKLARLMVVQEAYERRREAIAQYESRGLSGKEAREKASSHYGLIRGLVRSFMTMAHDGKDLKLMQWLYRSRSYGFKIRYTTTAEGKIQWIGDDVLYPKIRFSMSQFRGMIHGLVEEAREELFEKLMVVRMSVDGEVDGKQVPPISWDKMVDQPSETKVGWLFLDDERNQFAACKQWWLYERMYKEEQLRGQFMDSAGRLKREAVAAYQRHVERFQELLWVVRGITVGSKQLLDELVRFVVNKQLQPPVEKPSASVQKRSLQHTTICKVEVTLERFVSR